MTRHVKSKDLSASILRSRFPKLETDPGPRLLRIQDCSVLHSHLSHILQRFFLEGLQNTGSGLPDVPICCCTNGFEMHGSSNVSIAWDYRIMHVSCSALNSVGFLQDVITDQIPLTATCIIRLHVWLPLEAKRLLCIFKAEQLYIAECGLLTPCAT